MDSSFPLDFEPVLPDGNPKDFRLGSSALHLYKPIPCSESLTISYWFSLWRALTDNRSKGEFV